MTASLNVEIARRNNVLRVPAAALRSSLVEERSSSPKSKWTARLRHSRPPHRRTETRCWAPPSRNVDVSGTSATGTERKRVKVARRGAGGPADSINDNRESMMKNTVKTAVVGAIAAAFVASVAIAGGHQGAGDQQQPATAQGRQAGPGGIARPWRQTRRSARRSICGSHRSAARTGEGDHGGRAAGAAGSAGRDGAAAVSRTGAARRFAESAEDRRAEAADRQRDRQSR